MTKIIIFRQYIDLAQGGCFIYMPTVSALAQKEPFTYMKKNITSLTYVCLAQGRCFVYMPKILHSSRMHVYHGVGVLFICRTLSDPSRTDVYRKGIFRLYPKTYYIPRVHMLGAGWAFRLHAKIFTPFSFSCLGQGYYFVYILTIITPPRKYAQCRVDVLLICQKLLHPLVCMLSERWILFYKPNITTSL